MRVEGKTPLSTEGFVKLCSQKLNYVPDFSDMREVLRVLRELF